MSAVCRIKSCFSPAFRKAVALAVLTTLFTLHAHAQPFDRPEAFRWDASDNGVTITGRTGTGRDMRIPPYIQGMPVIGIGTGAFLNVGLTSVTIPGSVTSIGAMAFAYNELESVTIPDSVIYIGAVAFARNRLSDISIPYGVSSIGYGAFRDNLLSRVIIPASLVTIGDGAFGDAVVLTAPAPAPAPAPPLFAPMPPVIARQPQPLFEDPARFWSAGVSGGVSIAEPLMDSGAFIAGGTLQVTLAPWRNSFIRIGCDILQGSHQDYSHFSSLSIYPFGHLALFLPLFGWYGGVYLGAGAGFMIKSYSSRYDENSDSFFAMDLFTVGITFTLPFFGRLGFNASYTMRTDFSALTDRISLGVVYRFRSGGIR